MRELTAHERGRRGRHGGPAVLALDDGDRYYLSGAADCLLLDFRAGLTEADLLAVVAERLQRAEACPHNAAALRYVTAARAHLGGKK